MIGYKISSFFLILVLLSSVTNLSTFSTTQLNSDLHYLNGLSIGVAFADDDDDDEDEDDDNSKDKKEKKVDDKKSDVAKHDEHEDDDKDDDDDDDEEGDEDDDDKKDKITICHIPPGNPGNAHTIKVSGNAKNAHLAHGDTLGECPDNGDDNQDDDGQDNIATITLTKQVTNDNLGTAGSNDFKISVNGTIVLSGSTTKVAPNVLFAINETAADGYEFVKITGDTGCPTNLDVKTISLAPGKDINCVIHNNDVGQASSSSFQPNESTSEVDATPDNDELSQLAEENKKLREDLERQGEQIDDLNEQIDYLSEIISRIQGFFGSIFG